MGLEVSGRMFGYKRCSKYGIIKGRQATPRPGVRDHEMPWISGLRARPRG